MSERDHFNNIETIVQTDWETPGTSEVAWPNQHYAPPTDDDTIYIIFENVILDTIQSSTGSIGLERVDGLISVKVVGPKGQGDGLIRQMAEDFKAIFNRSTRNKIKFETGRLETLGEHIPGKWVVAVLIPWWTDQ
jgi:hypothetical protein